MSFAGDAGADSIIITTEFRTVGIDETKAKFSSLREEIQGQTQSMGMNSAQWRQVGAGMNDATIGMRTMMSPIRTVSWDFMLLGRGLNIINSELLGSNKEFQRWIGVIYIAASALRVLVATSDIINTVKAFSVMLLGKEIALHTANTVALNAEAQAYLAVRMAAGDPTAIGMSVYNWANQFGSGIKGAGSWSIPGAQSGGYVAQSGLAVIHKGETVIPAGTSLNQIFINMSTGPLSSTVDVDRMLDTMASRMAQESRRRIGR